MTKIVGSHIGLFVEGTELFLYVHILFRPQNDPFMIKEYPRKINILYITCILRTSSRSYHSLINAPRSRTSKPARRAMVFQTETFGIIFCESWHESCQFRDVQLLIELDQYPQVLVCSVCFYQNPTNCHFSFCKRVCFCFFLFHCLYWPTETIRNENHQISNQDNNTETKRQIFHLTQYISF